MKLNYSLIYEFSGSDSRERVGIISQHNKKKKTALSLELRRRINVKYDFLYRYATWLCIPIWITFKHVIRVFYEYV